VTTPAAKPPEGGAVPPLPLAAPETAADGYFYDPKGRREPFQSMVQLIKKMKEGSELPPLQRVEISDMKLLGIIWGGYGYFGLIQTPDGKGYTVKEGTLLGTNGGVIKAITDKQLIVAEPTIDIAGKKTTREIEILLRAKEGIK
jgi:type IV pilus assembly protein PilP